MDMFWNILVAHNEPLTCPSPTAECVPYPASGHANWTGTRPLTQAEQSPFPGNWKWGWEREDESFRVAGSVKVNFRAVAAICQLPYGSNN